MPSETNFGPKSRDGSGGFAGVENDRLSRRNGSLPPLDWVISLATLPQAICAAFSWHGRLAREECTHAGRSYSTDISKSAAFGRVMSKRSPRCALAGFDPGTDRITWSTTQHRRGTRGARATSGRAGSVVGLVNDWNLPVGSVASCKRRPLTRLAVSCDIVFRKREELS
jgi:hypothetical protein